MARRERPPDAEPPGAPDWIVTFSDMISLLVTFFVMLMSFSTLEEREAMFIVGAFADGKTGILHNEDGASAVPAPLRDRMSAVHTIRGAVRPHVRPDEALLENLEEMGQKKDDERLEVDFTRVPDGLVVSFDERGGFAPGSAEIAPQLQLSLGELAAVLQHYPHLIVVEGFADGRFAPTPRHPTAEAVSAARAAAAARVMLRSSRLQPELLQIAGLGAERPRATNETASGRARNRRVEVRIVSLSKARAQALDAARAAGEGSGAGGR